MYKNKEMKEKYFTVDSDKMIQAMLDNEVIFKLGECSRFEDENTAFGEIKGDNTFNWELIDEDDDTQYFYSLSNNFEIREDGRLLTLSKHIGKDIRGGYEDDIIFIKKDGDVSFWELVNDYMRDFAQEDK